MIRQLIILTCSIFCMSSSCKKPPGAESVYSIWIKNNSGLQISYLISQNYPDTLVPNQESSLLMLQPGEDKTFDQKKIWEEFFDSLPADTLSIFFFSNDTLNKYNFQQISSDYNVLKRKDVSYNDVKNNNYEIAFP